MIRFVSAAAFAAGFCVVSSATAAITASSVVEYVSNGEPTFNNTAAVLGLPSRTGPFGDLTPFSPNFSTDDILRIPAGGSLTLRLSQPVAVTGGLQLGVISNVGVIDVSADGSGLAGNPARAFSPFPVAQLSVSADGVHFFPVEAGPSTFDMPALGFIDTPAWTNYSPRGGTTPSRFDKPVPAAVHSGGLQSLAGLNFGEIASLFEGSGGGSWFDVSSTNLASFEFVKFDVPASSSADVRMILDAVVAVPEPMAACVLIAASLVAVRRR